jgi:hypothetical protein
MPAAIQDIPIPDPRTWPAGVRERYRELAGDCGPLDVVIFVFGRIAAFYLADAVTACGILDIDPSGWHVEDGFPAYHFSSGRIEEYSRRLTACGYAVRIIEPGGHDERAAAGAPRAAVINIASARRPRIAL